MIILRDNRKLIGVLRSYDQYGEHSTHCTTSPRLNNHQANLVLQNAIERFHSLSTKTYADVPRGVYLVRGENVLMLAEVDLDLEDEPRVIAMQGERRDVETVTRNMRKEDEERKAKATEKGKLLYEQRGFSIEHAEGDAY